MIKIAHEAPKCIFQRIQDRTDIDYFLVHLFEEDREYLELAKSAKLQGREIILDNSIFELGKAFDAERFAYWITELEPTWYIVPDVLEDSEGTITNMENWLKKYRDLPGKRIGVIQGKNYQELRTCYTYMDRVAEVDMIAISFDYSYYGILAPHSNRYVSWMMGRVILLGKLQEEGIIATGKKHHLLGNSLSMEGKFYGSYDWIYSIDTSNPVVHGIKGIPYQANFGLYSKESQKLYELMNVKELDTTKIDTIIFNVEEFRNYWNRDQFKATTC